MNIYLDIDGTLVHEAGERAGEPAEGLEDFLVALRPHDTFWLTTHCMDGDPTRARALVKSMVPEALYADVDRIKPTAWSMQKTEAIDFSGQFIWFDNDVTRGEYDALRARAIHDRQWLLEVHLDRNPRRLIEIVRDVLSDL